MSNELKMFINNRKDRVSATINFRHNSLQMASNRFFLVEGSNQKIESFTYLTLNCCEHIKVKKD